MRTDGTGGKIEGSTRGPRGPKNARDTKSTNKYYIYCAMHTINDQQEECWRILLGTQSIIYQEIFHFFIRREFWEWEWERENEN